jgi:hypothetical protein
MTRLMMALTHVQVGNWASWIARWTSISRICIRGVLVVLRCTGGVCSRTSGDVEEVGQRWPWGDATANTAERGGAWMEHYDDPWEV